MRHYPSFQWGLRCFFMSSTTPSNHCQKVKLRPGKLSYYKLNKLHQDVYRHTITALVKLLLISCFVCEYLEWRCSKSKDLILAIPYSANVSKYDELLKWVDLTRLNWAQVMVMLRKSSGLLLLLVKAFCARKTRLSSDRPRLLCISALYFILSASHSWGHSTLSGTMNGTLPWGVEEG